MGLALRLEANTLRRLPGRLLKLEMPGYLRQVRETSHDRSDIMKSFYQLIAISLVVTVIAVAFVPGVDDLVEEIFQRYLGRAAR